MRTLTLVDYSDLAALETGLKFAKRWQQENQTIVIMSDWLRTPKDILKDAMVIQEWGYHSLPLLASGGGVVDETRTIFDVLNNANVFHVSKRLGWIGDLYDGHYSDVLTTSEYYFEGWPIRNFYGYGHILLLAAVAIRARKDGFEKVLYVTKASDPHPSAGESKCEIWLDLMRLVKVAFPCPYLQVLVHYDASGFRILSQT